MLGSWSLSPLLSTQYGKRRRSCRAEDETLAAAAAGGSVPNKNKNKKVLVVGSGWAGLGAAHHLSKQGFDVSVLEGGYDLGPTRLATSPDDFGIRGFWRPFRNIFNLVEELGIEPFTKWTKSALYSREGLEVEFPIFQKSPELPAPFGIFLYPKFTRLSVVDRLSSIPLMAAVVDFDNTDTSWRKYDAITTRELFRQFGCSERLYQDVLNPLLQVGLFAPAEQCSAAATIGMLYYLVLAHQKDFDLVWCRGTVREKIFEPLTDSMKDQGCKFLEGRKVTELVFNEETGCISGVACGKESLKADAVILAVSISMLQDIIQNSAALCTREEFLKVLNLVSIDLVTVKLQLDKKVNIPSPCNACSGFDNSNGWTFSDLNVIYDEHKENPATVVQADFFHANELMPMKDEDVVAKAMNYLSRCIKDFEKATVVDKEIRRFPKSLTHFFPGSYKYMMRGSTSFPNLFMAGDWIINRHGSWSQEKSFVTGLEAANRVIDYLEEGTLAKIIPVEEDEPHIQALRFLTRNLNDVKSQLPWSNYFIE